MLSLRFELYNCRHVVDTGQTSTRIRDMSSVAGPSRQAATRSRIRCFISESGKVDASRAISARPSTPSISRRELKVVREAIRVQHDPVAGFEGNLDGRFLAHSIVKTSQDRARGL